jgi:hypothetical protein
LAKQLRILVSGALAGGPPQGGATWAVLQYALGFERLGHDVSVIQPVDEASPETIAYLNRIVLEFGLRATLLQRGQSCPFAPGTDVLINISGMLRDVALESIPIRVYLDLDPVFNQLWHLQGVDVGLDGHTHYVTVGARVPSCGFEWTPTLPPVVLECWPPGGRIKHDALTTVANWRSYGPIEHDGVRYGQKAHSLRRFLDLPARSVQRFELALGIDPGEARDLEALAQHGWHLLDPRAVAGTPSSYSDFVRSSRGELGIAKEGYVVSRSGWFSDRSACYLASGRPVLAQDTGFDDRLPTGAGLFAFKTTDDAVVSIEELRRDYGRNARAARAIAEEFLDSDRVLERLLQEVGAVSRSTRRRVHEMSVEELGRLLGGRILHKRPFEYRSTAPMVEVDVRFADGSTSQVLVKDLSRSAQTDEARRAKPDFLVDPQREIEVYRQLLADAGLGTPRVYAASTESLWLAIEKVEGVELYQIGELSIWQEALRWLARMHDHFRGKKLPGWLINYDAEFLMSWLARARAISALEGFDGYDEAVGRLASLPRTLLHGEFYASHLLVGSGRVCAVDWELAGSGPGVIDVAAITMGWADRERLLLAETYRSELTDPPSRAQFERDLDCARLHLAVQWLGWSPDWSPPPEHSRDFRSEARLLVDRLAL